MQVFILGGNANNSSKAGVFYTNANNTSSNDNANIGTQLSLFNRCINLAPWQKTKRFINGLVG